VSEQEDVVAALEEAGILAGVRWAYTSASTRTLESYCEADGHDAAWLGNTRFTLFRDRLDRVFACGRYAVQPGTAGTASLDLLHAELADRDIAAMSQLPTDLVRRADLNGSPGWAWQEWRFLLASCAFGKLDRLPWPQKSPTKQRVASQPEPEPHPTLFDDDPAGDEIAGLIALQVQSKTLDLKTFVVAHALDAVSGDLELVFGRARLNSGGGDAWHWYEDLLTTGPADGGHRTDVSPPPTRPDGEPDAPVRLRRSASAQPGEEAG
jgi:hypothetical protein